jgi:hypothetical protein
MCHDAPLSPHGTESGDPTANMDKMTGVRAKEGLASAMPIGPGTLNRSRFFGAMSGRPEMAPCVFAWY